MEEAQYRVLKPVNTTLYIALTLACLLLLQPQVLAAGRQRQKTEPITRKDLVDTLTRDQNIPKRKRAKYIRLIEKHGVDFRITPRDVREIRKASGAYLTPSEIEELVDVTRANYRPTSKFLLGNIEQVEVIEKPGGGSRVFIRLSVVNDGSPTIVSKYTLGLYHTASDSLEFKGPPDGLNEPYTLPQSAGLGKIVIQPQDALTRKTAKAIARNGRVDGWLHFVLNHNMLTPEFLRQPGITYFVRIADVDGKTYEATYAVR
jgi:hypothetical protein